jgi:hypothetical protein
VVAKSQEEQHQMRKDVVAVWGVVAVAFVIAVSGAIGKLATPTGDHPYNWSVAALVATALGTLLLAVGTGALAWSTFDDVRATRELATVARDERRDGFRPAVIVQTVPRFGTPNDNQHNPGLHNPNGVVVLEIRNIGRGPARDIGIMVEWTPLPDLPPIRRAMVEIGPAFVTNLVPNESAPVRCPAAIFNTTELTPSEWAQRALDGAGFFTVAIEFNDWNGEVANPYRWSGDTRTGTA